MVALVVAVPFLTPASGQGKPQDGKPAGPPAMKVAVDAVVEQPLAQTVPVIGRLVARKTGVVAARINGPVGEFKVEVGDRVKKGDVIAVLVDDVLKTRFALEKAEEQQFAAAVRTRKAQIKLRHQELARIEGLEKSAAFSKARQEDKRQEVVVAESELAEAEGKLASAKANRELAYINLYNATVRAPYVGVVSKRHIETGAYVNIGEPLVTLVNDQHLEIEADVPNDRIPALTPGTAVSGTINGGPKITAEVRAVVPSENPQTRTRTVRFVPDIPDGVSRYAANQSVTLQLPAAQANDVVTVHKDAVLARNGGRIVYRVMGDEAHARPIVLGDAVGNRFVVKSGLTPGDMVVVRGNERLRPGQKVIVGAPDGGPGKAPAKPAQG